MESMPKDGHPSDHGVWDLEFVEASADLSHCEKHATLLVEMSAVFHKRPLEIPVQKLLVVDGVAGDFGHRSALSPVDRSILHVDRVFTPTLSLLFDAPTPPAA